MRTWEAVVRSGRVLRPVTVLVSLVVRVERVLLVWLESEERNWLLLLPLEGGEDGPPLLSIPLIPLIRFHAPE